MVDPQKRNADTAQTWCRVASELQAYRASQQQAWGNVDNATLGRYLAGELDGEEHRQVEEALEAFPELQRLTLLVQDVLGEAEAVPSPASPAAAPAEAPVVLPIAEFRSPNPPARREARPRGRTRRWAPRLALLAAASVMLALGLNLTEPGRLLFPSQESPIRAEKAVALAASGGEGLAMAEGPRFAVRARSTPGAVPRLDRRPDRSEGPRAAPADNLAGVYTAALNTVAATDDQVVTSWESLEDSTAPRENPTPAAWGGKNPYYMLTPGENPYRIVVKAKDEQTPATRNAWLIYAGIASQKAEGVQDSVLPVLVQALRDAPNTKEKAKLARAIGRLGPAARIAVPTLASCLHKAQTDEERRAFLFALNQVGLGADVSGARRAVPEVLETLSCECPQARQLAAQVLVQVAPESREQIALALREKSDSGALRQILREARDHPARIGVRDPYQCFNVHTLCEAQKQINQLVQKNDVKVLVETVPASSLGESTAPEPLHGKRLFIRIARDGSDVRVVSCPSLEKRGLRPEHLRQLVQDNTRKGAFDAGLLEGLQYLTRAVTE